MSTEPQTVSMARRALLTDGEREALIDPESRENPYVTVSRVRKKIQEQLPRDVEILEEHHPGLLDELRDVVCPDAERIAGGDSSEPQEDSEPAEYDTFEETDDEFGGDARTVPGWEPDPDDESELLDRLGHVDLPGSGTSLQRRKENIVRLYQALREQGEMKSAELRDLVDLDGTGYGSIDSFWINVVSKPDTNPLAALPGVEAPGQGGQFYRYHGEDDDGR